MYVLAGVLLAMLLGALEATIVGPAMPHIVSELHGAAHLAWVFTVYSLTSTVAIPIVGKLSDLYGRKWFYIGGIVVFVIGSALSGSAVSMSWLIVARGVQGVGGGMMMANGMAVIGDLFEPRERARYQGLMGATFALASVVGAPIGGFLTDNASWRWIFFINLPLGLAALAVLMLALPRPEQGLRHAIDWWGSSALVLGLVPLLLALNWGGSEYGWTSPIILGLVALSLGALAVFVFLERRAAEPIIDIALFADRSFRASTLTLLFSGSGMFGSIMFVPLYLQFARGASAASSAFVLLPMTLGMVSASIVTGQLIARTGRYKLYGVVGLAVATAGMFSLSQVSLTTPRALVGVFTALIGAGVGVTMPLFTIALQAQFPERIGEVTAAVQFFRSIGGTVGVALLGGVLNASFTRGFSGRVSEKAAAWGAASDIVKQAARRAPELLNESAYSSVTRALGGVSDEALATFVTAVRGALASAVGTSFAIATVLMGLAWLAFLAVREVPLAMKPSLDTPAEVGTELLAEEAVQPAEHEPTVMGDGARAAAPHASEQL